MTGNGTTESAGELALIQENTWYHIIYIYHIHFWDLSRLTSTRRHPRRRQQQQKPSWGWQWWHQWSMIGHIWQLKEDNESNRTERIKREKSAPYSDLVLVTRGSNGNVDKAVLLELLKLINVEVGGSLALNAEEKSHEGDLLASSLGSLTVLWSQTLPQNNKKKTQKMLTRHSKV